MARLRLFANLRELAGASEVDVPGDTLGQVLETANDKFGVGFAAAAGHARAWLNGAAASLEASVGAEDEIALIPPVSGGAAPVVSARGGTELLVALVVALFLANFTGPSWFAAVTVGFISLWIIDITATARASRLVVDPIPLIGAAVVGGVAGHGLGVDGLAFAMASGLVIAVVWAMGSSQDRSLAKLGPVALLSMVSAAAPAALVGARQVFTGGEDVVLAVLLVVTLAEVAAWSAAKWLEASRVDPYTAAALTAVVVSVLAALILSLHLVAFLLTGVGMAISLIAGKTLGGLVRIGEVSMTELYPGTLAHADGGVLVAATFLPLLLLVL